MTTFSDEKKETKTKTGKKPWLAAAGLGLLAASTAVAAASLGGLVDVTASSGTSGSGGAQASGSSSIQSSGTGGVTTYVTQTSTATGSDAMQTQTSSSSVNSQTSSDANAVMQSHFAQLSTVVEDAQSAGLDAGMVDEARGALAVETQAWSQAGTQEAKESVVNDMNAYWSRFKQEVRSSGIGFDFDTALSLDDNGVLSASTSSAQGGNAQASSSGMTQTEAQASTNAQGMPSLTAPTQGPSETTATVSQNAAAEGMTQPSATASSAGSNVVTAFFGGIASFFSQVAATIGLWFH